MKKIIFLLILISNATFAKEGSLDSYWMDGTGFEKSAETANLDSIDNFIGNFTDAELDALDSVKFPVDKADVKPKWYFAGAQTSLGVGFSGAIGLLTFGGTKSLEVNWERKKPEPKNKSDDEEISSSVETVTVNEGTSKADLNKELEPFIRSVVDSKKVTSEATLRNELKEVSGKFLAYVKGVSASQHRYRFVPTKIRLEFNVEGSGKLSAAAVAPYLTGKVTVPVKIRLEFIRVMKKDAPVVAPTTATTVAPKSEDVLITPDMTETEKKIATQTKSLLDKLAEEVTLAYSEEVKAGDMEKRDIVLKYIEVGLGFGVEGKIGIATFKANMIPSIFFQKFDLANSVAPKIDKSVDEESIPVFVDDESSSDKGL
ncbi:MAG: hypothetical protein ACHQYQ_05330 [Bacteriovoracales bacterium]